MAVAPAPAAGLLRLALLCVACRALGRASAADAISHSDGPRWRGRIVLTASNWQTQFPEPVSIFADEELFQAEVQCNDQRTTCSGVKLTSLPQQGRTELLTGITADFGTVRVLAASIKRRQALVSFNKGGKLALALMGPKRAAKLDSSSTQQVALAPGHDGATLVFAVSRTGGKTRTTVFSVDDDYDDADVVQKVDALPVYLRDSVLFFAEDAAKSLAVNYRSEAFEDDDEKLAGRPLRIARRQLSFASSASTTVLSEFGSTVSPRYGAPAAPLVGNMSGQGRLLAGDVSCDTSSVHYDAAARRLSVVCVGEDGPGLYELELRNFGRTDLQHAHFHRPAKGEPAQGVVAGAAAALMCLDEDCKLVTSVSTRLERDGYRDRLEPPTAYTLTGVGAPLDISWTVDLRGCALIALGTRLGCLEEKPRDDPQCANAAGRRITLHESATSSRSVDICGDEHMLSEYFDAVYTFTFANNRLSVFRYRFGAPAREVIVMDLALTASEVLDAGASDPEGRYAFLVARSQDGSQRFMVVSFVSRFVKELADVVRVQVLGDVVLAVRSDDAAADVIYALPPGSSVFSNAKEDYTRGAARLRLPLAQTSGEKALITYYTAVLPTHPLRLRGQPADKDVIFVSELVRDGRLFASLTSSFQDPTRFAMVGVRDLARGTYLPAEVRLAHFPQLSSKSKAESLSLDLSGDHCVLYYSEGGRGMAQFCSLDWSTSHGFDAVDAVITSIVIVGIIAIVAAVALLCAKRTPSPRRELREGYSEIN